jgi:VCBS repeat-containing protein
MYGTRWGRRLRPFLAKVGKLRPSRRTLDKRARLDPEPLEGRCVPSVTVSVSPSYVELAPGKTQQFTATVAGSASTDVTWSNSDPSPFVHASGSLTANGLFMSGVGLYTGPNGDMREDANVVLATSNTNPSVTGHATVVPLYYQGTATYTFTGGTYGPWDTTLLFYPYDQRTGQVALTYVTPASPYRQATGTVVLTADQAASGSVDDPFFDLSWNDTAVNLVLKSSPQSAPTQFIFTANQATFGQPPVARDDSYTTGANTTLLVQNPNGGVLSNDSDRENDATFAVLESGPAHGDMYLAQNGTLAYRPAANFVGQDRFTYFAQDRDGAGNSATVTITVGPNAKDDSYDDPRNTTLRVPASTGVLANDNYGADRPAAKLVDDVRHGTLTLNDDGSFVYTPDQDFKTTPTTTESFTYQLEDRDGNKSNITTVNLRVGLPPMAINDTYQIKRGATLVVHADTGVLANDTDAETPKDPVTAVIETLPQNAQDFTLYDDGSFSYTPKNGFAGDDTFKYKARDQDGTSDTAATVTITVGIKPKVIDHSYKVDANGSLLTDDSNGVLAGATEEGGENDQVTAMLKAGPFHGKLLRPGLPDGLFDDGSFSYFPDAGYRGPDSFTYVAHDQDGDSNVATVTIQVGKVPVVKDHSYVVPRATNGTSLDPLVVDSDQPPYQRLLADATPGETGMLTATKLSDPVHGVLDFNPDGGSFTYTVTDTGFHGPDSFTYKAKDGDVESNTATVTITVGAAPKAKDHAYKTARGVPLEVGSDQRLLADATDAEGDPITAEIDTPPSSDSGSISDFDGATGTFTFTPSAGFKGDVTFTYRAIDLDGKSDPATVTITVGLKPVAKDHTYSVHHGTMLVVDAASGVLSDATDVENDPLTMKVKSGPLYGTLTPSDDGSFNYTPDPGFATTDSFTYVAHDQDGDSNTATVTIRAGQVPQAAADTYNVAAGTTLTVAPADGVLKNDTEPDSGDTMTAVVRDFPTRGKLIRFEDDGSFVYQPDDGVRGPDQFTYQAQDQDGQSSTVTVTVNVGLVPEASNDEYTLARGATLTLDADHGVLKNDSDVEHDALTAVEKDGPSKGQLTLDDDGALTYTPNSGSRGMDTFTYVAHDVDGDSDPATVTIKIGVPEATNDSYAGSRDSQLVVNAAAGVLQNDTDSENDPLTAVLQTQASHGQVILHEDGSFEYTPNPGSHDNDSFMYIARDQDGDSEPARVTIAIGRPAANDDSYTVPRDTTLTVDADDGVLANDTDPEHDPLSAVLGTTTEKGQLTLFASGAFTYSPPNGFRGPESFTYVAHDVDGDSNTATVKFTVGAPPDVKDDSYQVERNTTLTVAADEGVLKNDSDDENDPIMVELKDPPHGHVDLRPDGSFTYTPGAGSQGDDSFTYIAHDQDGESEPATVTIKVGKPPEVQDHDYETRANTSLSITPGDGVLSDASDAENDFFTAVLKEAQEGQTIAPTEHGSVVLDSDGAFTYTPDPGFIGTDTFKYLARDQDGDSDDATVTINVKTLVMVNAMPVVFGTSALFGGPIVALAVPSPPSIPQAPAGVTFPFGVFRFNVVGIDERGSATVTMEFPAPVSTFWKYGPTPQNPTAHWYQFLYHNQTDTDDASDTGAEIAGNRVTLHLVDGERGDDDLTPDGVIVDPGGPAALTSTPTPTPTSTPTATPSPTPAPSATVHDIHVATVKLSHKKTVKELVVDYSSSDPLPAAANLAAYHLVTVVKKKKSGTHAGKPVALVSATFNAATNSVTLTPRGKFPSQTLQLDISAALVVDPQGRPLNGGHNVTATISPGGAVTARAVDELLAVRNGAWFGGLREGS